MVSMIVLIGIAAGAVVFVGTILTVFFLLHQGGSFDRMKKEAVGMPMADGELKPQLYDELLALAARLPRKPAVLESPLQGEIVCIRGLLVEPDASVLHSISNGQPRGGIYREIRYDDEELIWRYLDHGPFKSQDEFARVHCSEADNCRHLVITDAKSTQPIGMLTLASHSPTDLRIEIRDLWLTPAFQGSGAITETILLVLRHLFANKYRRIEWRCDGYNIRARRAAHSHGLAFEGVMRKHRIVKECNQDTVVFAALNSDWPAIEEHLVGKLAAVLARKEEAGEAAVDDDSKKKDE